MDATSESELRRRLESVLPYLGAAPAMARVEHAPSRRRVLAGISAIAAAVVTIVGVTWAIARSVDSHETGTPLQPGSHSTADLKTSTTSSPGSTATATSTRFPQALYPPPRAFPDWGYEGGCPSLSGTKGSSPRSNPGTVVAALGGGYDADRSLTDQALWPVLQTAYNGSGFDIAPNGTRFAVAPASEFYQAALVRHGCGAVTVARSTLVHICPSGTTTCTVGTGGALSVDALLLHREGRWLVWFTTA
jgi:hypothetical protein